MTLDAIVHTQKPDEILRNLFAPLRMFDGVHDLVSTSRLQEVLKWMEQLELLPGNTKVLDLGAGNGWPIAVFANAGYSTYGIEKEPNLVEEAESTLSSLGIQAEIIQGDYYSPQFPNIQFKDGTRLRDINFVFCYSYNSGKVGEKFHPIILVEKVISKPGTFSRDTVFYINSLYSILHLDELARSHGFDRIPEIPSRFLIKTR